MSDKAEYVEPSNLDHIKTYYDATDTGITNPSRYKRLRRVIDDDGDEYIETPDYIYIPTSSNDRFYEVTNETRNRIEMISNMYYGTPLLWWVIAMASDLDDPMILPIGTILRIPSTNTLYNIGGILS